MVISLCVDIGARALNTRKISDKNRAKTTFAENCIPTFLISESVNWIITILESKINIYVQLVKQNKLSENSDFWSFLSCVCFYNSTKKFHREVSSSMYNLSDFVCITVVVYCKLYTVVQSLVQEKWRFFILNSWGFQRIFMVLAYS